MPKDVEPGYAHDESQMCPLLAPKDRLEYTTPTSGQHKPAAVLSDGTGQAEQITGTILTVDNEETGLVKINTAKDAEYFHQVRNVLTYSAELENTFAQLNFGMKVYYDRSSTMPAGVFLSLSPLDKDGNSNPFFGHVVWADTEYPDPFQGDRDPYPVGSAVSGVTHTDIVIRQK